MPFSIYLRGLGLGASLIVAIGAQNAFVLRQGLRRQFVFITAVICILCDAVMFSVGALGFGSLVASFPALKTITAWGGALFLLAYGAMSLRSAYRGGAMDVDTENSDQAMTLRAVVLTTLAVSLLNPHVFPQTSCSDNRCIEIALTCPTALSIRS